jgi:hypothetical protein
MIEFDETTDAPSGTYGRPVVITAKMDKQIPGKKGLAHPLIFAANQAFTQQLGVKYDIVLLKQV